MPPCEPLLAQEDGHKLITGTDARVHCMFERLCSRVCAGLVLRFCCWGCGLVGFVGLGKEYLEVLDEVGSRAEQAADLVVDISAGLGVVLVRVQEVHESL